MSTERKDIRDILQPGRYEREYEAWKAEYDKAARSLAGWINTTARDLDTLRSDPESQDDWERVSAMQDLVNRMYSEYGDLPGVKSTGRPLDRKRASAVSPGAHSTYR